jgi:hypothetical protein
MDKNSLSGTTGTRRISHLDKYVLGKRDYDKARFDLAAIPAWLRGLESYRRGETSRGNSRYLNEKINERLKEKT